MAAGGEAGAGAEARRAATEPGVEPSPRSEPQGQQQKQRVVGWREGSALTAVDVQEILRRERRARHEYKGLRKASTKPQQAAGQSDPLAGLPPTWQAFYSSVPHLDPQAAYRQFRREQQRQVRAKAKASPTKAATVAAAAEGLLSDEEEAAIEEEALRLDEEVRRKKQVLAERMKTSDEWDRKLGRARALDRDEAELSRRVLRKLEAASYEYGILEGKIRSSEIYFNFLHEDTKIAHGKKVSSLRRSCALMDKQIDMLKSDVRGLLKAAAEERLTSEPMRSSEKKKSSAASSDQAGGGSRGGSLSGRRERARAPGSPSEEAAP